jgi:4'-phosphopantetheinyl transferase EntD
VLARLFPDGVAAAEMREAGDPSLLYPEEAACVQRAVVKRVREFAAGRACARRALAEIGIDDCPILVAHDRQPIWPDSVIGSITHTTGLCAAVVARKGSEIGLGLDCEVVSKVTEDLWPTICRPEETVWIESLPPSQRAAAAALLFSAKEAFYKCQYPVTGQWLDFHDIRVEPAGWDAQGAEFAVYPMRTLEVDRLAVAPMMGRYRFDDGFVMSGIALQRP